MAIQGMTFQNQIQGLWLAEKLGIKRTGNDDSDSFEGIFQNYLDFLTDTAGIEAQAEKIQLDYAVGRTDDMLSVMLAQEKASTMVTFAVQVTNKVIEAYREIMRIQL